MKVQLEYNVSISLKFIMNDWKWTQTKAGRAFKRVSHTGAQTNLCRRVNYYEIDRDLKLLYSTSHVAMNSYQIHTICSYGFETVACR